MLLIFDRIAVKTFPVSYPIGKGTLTTLKHLYKNLRKLRLAIYLAYLYLYLLHLYPGFYSYTEGATWKILDLLTETLLI